VFIVAITIYVFLVSEVILRVSWIALYFSVTYKRYTQRCYNWFSFGVTYNNIILFAVGSVKVGLDNHWDYY